MFHSGIKTILKEMNDYQSQIITLPLLRENAVKRHIHAGWWSDIQYYKLVIAEMTERD